jgi:NAD-dependent DNA ligase
MSDFFTRQSGAFRNEMTRSLGALLGIAQGMLCDGHLNDREVLFLQDWLTQNESIAVAWPGDVVHARVREVLTDGVITPEERIYLTETLQQLVGGTLEQIAEQNHVSELAIDRSVNVRFPDSSFCLTGDFVFAPREHCESAITKRGGSMSGVTKKLTYLVVGGLGSKEWKHGSFGTKVAKAVEYKRQGVPVLIVHEDQWASAL